MPRSVALGRERWVLFNHITERHQIRVEHPVIFKIGQTHVLISTVSSSAWCCPRRVGAEV